MTIGERWDATQGRPSGFDYMRIVLALSVMFWHAYGVTYGPKVTADAWSSSIFGYILPVILPMFFALSGFLISGSMYRNPDLRIFLTLRAIRIFPALVVELGLSALILGPIVSSYDIENYFSNRDLYEYAWNLIGYIHYDLPGVFLTNPIPNVVNASLWTVPFELDCYLLISILAIIGFFKFQKIVIPTFVFVTLVVGITNFRRHVASAPASGVQGNILTLCFFAGIVIYSFRKHIKWSGWWAIIAFTGTCALFKCSDWAAYLAPIPAAYVTVYLGLLNPKRNIVVNSGDYSYGVYLYAFPIQQAISLCLGTHRSWLGNTVCSLLVIIPFALLSWWCVEKPFLTLRRYIRTGTQPRAKLARMNKCRPLIDGHTLMGDLAGQSQTYGQKQGN